MEMFSNRPKWSKVPGCFERHLQRRDGNVLFPLERRIVSREEVEQAQRRDKLDQERFIEAVRNLKIELNNSEDRNPLFTSHNSSFLQRVQALLEEAASIGGNIENAIHILETTEEKMIQCLNASMPEGKELLEKAKSLSTMHRIPYLAQMKRRDTPILENEQVPTLLSEDFATISIIGYVSRRFPDFKPSDSDVRMFVEKAVRHGFDEGTAQRILDAWNEMQ